MPVSTPAPLLQGARRAVRHLGAALLLVLGSAPLAQAQPDAVELETSKRVGDYTIHYVIFPSTFLREDIASQLQLVRAPNRSLVNISVRRDAPGGGDVAKTALVTGGFTDLIQPKTLEFREVREQDAIYYLAEFRHGNNETLRFTVNVQPDPNAPAQTLTFTRTLYVEQ